MKSCILVLALFGIAAFAAAAPKELEGFYESDKVELKKAVDYVQNQIDEEREADKNIIAVRTAKRDDSKASFDDAEARLVVALAAEKKAEEFLALKEKELTAAQTEFARAETTRSAEEAALSNIKLKVGELSSIGGAEKTLGNLPEAPAAPTDPPEFALLQEGRAQELRDMLLELRRGFNKVPMTTKLDEMDAAVKAERVQDQARVDKATKERDDAKIARDKAVAFRQAEQAHRDRMERIYNASEAALKFEQAEVDKAEAGRVQEEKSLQEIWKKIEELYNIRVEAEKERKASLNPGLEDLQRAGVSSTEKLKEVLGFMLMDVQDEEQAAKENIAEAKLREAEALKIKNAAEVVYQEAIQTHEAAVAAHGRAVALWEAARKALATERSIANQERDMIKDLLETVEQLTNVKESTGNCEKFNGIFCHGAGTCEADNTCKCNIFHDGANCEFCKTGSHKENGVCVPDESMANLLEYSASDIGQILLSVSRAGSVDKMAGVKKLLDEMKDKLDATDKTLSDKKAAAEQVKIEAKAAMDKAKAEMDAALIDLNKKIEIYKTKRIERQTLEEQFAYEQPIREQEYKAFKELDELIAKLEGQAVYEKKDNEHLKELNAADAAAKEANYNPEN